ncbi:unnamed protein product [Psylliodes chrysocephalus]|uniref:Uncharacterized protein n=1 Tax=Psylliodes chrysocephalus TaxID=3402493 RepID=A0A9P0CVC9_9CUCU|nr:unnamed protein product [Psylliodes chrysocephala]
MAVIKKKIKRVESNNTYLPHKIRSHPFYCINLPLRVTVLFIFYWIVLVPVLYYIFSTYVPGFVANTLPYFLVMFVVFLIIMGIFVKEWRSKAHTEKKGIYYIKYETPDSVDNLEVKQSIIDIERQPQEVILRKKSREMIFLCDRRQIIENQRSLLIEEIKDTIYQRENKPERPTNIRIEETVRPVSQTANSPLTPRELFFLDMYEYAKAMRDVTDEFIRKERYYYIASGPVSRSYSCSESSSDTQVIESPSSYEYPDNNRYIRGKDTQVFESPSSYQYPDNDRYIRGKFYLDDEDYPKSLKEQSKESQSPVSSDHSNLLKVLENLSADKNGNGSPYSRFEIKEVDNERYPKRVSYTIKEQQLLQQQPIMNKPVPNYDLNILKVLKEYSTDNDGQFVPRGRIEVKEIKKEREYFIANVVPQESCVTEAFLYVDEIKSDKKPKQIVAKFRESF